MRSAACKEQCTHKTHVIGSALPCLQIKWLKTLVIECACPCLQNKRVVKHKRLDALNHACTTNSRKVQETGCADWMYLTMLGNKRVVKYRRLDAIVCACQIEGCETRVTRCA